MSIRSLIKNFSKRGKLNIKKGLYSLTPTTCMYALMVAEIYSACQGRLTLLIQTIEELFVFPQHIPWLSPFYISAVLTNEDDMLLTFGLAAWYNSQCSLKQSYTL